MSIIKVSRFHDFSYGHRVCGHENKCRHLHGHNGRVHFECSSPELDSLGRVIDFGVIKSLLCAYVEDHWDHRMLLSHDDPWAVAISDIDSSVLIVPFNPTAENMARWLLEEVGPELLASADAEITLTKVIIEETRKCSASAEL